MFFFLLSMRIRDEEEIFKNHDTPINTARHLRRINYFGLFSLHVYFIADTQQIFIRIRIHKQFSLHTEATIYYTRK